MAASSCLWKLLRTPANNSRHNKTLRHTHHNLNIYVFNSESGLISSFLMPAYFFRYLTYSVRESPQKSAGRQILPVGVQYLMFSQSNQ